MTDTADVAGPVVLLTDTVPLQTFYAWERDGVFLNAQPGDGQEVPYDAAHLLVKVYTYPSAEIRVLRFLPDVRTHDHVNKTDTILYEWTARRVQFVNHDAAICDPGDFALHPKGVFHHGEVLTPGLAVEWAMAVGPPGPDPTPTFVESGREPFEAAGAGVQMRTVPLGPYTSREVRLTAGTTQDLDADADGELLTIVLSGRLAVDVYGANHELGVEDTVRLPLGERATRTALEDVVLVETRVPWPRDLSVGDGAAR